MTSTKVVSIIVLSLAVVLVYGFNLSMHFPFYTETKYVVAYASETGAVENVVEIEKVDNAVETPKQQRSETIDTHSEAQVETTTHITGADDMSESHIRKLPFYSQFSDISKPRWQKVSCGIASIAMLIEYYKEPVSADTLLQDGVASGYFLESAGWTHAGLIDLTRAYGLDGKSVSLSHLSMTEAFESLKSAVEEGPVVASVYYTFTPGHPIPHLVTVNDIKDGLVYYSDPADASGNRSMALEDFKPAWKKRYIEIRPL